MNSETLISALKYLAETEWSYLAYGLPGFFILVIFYFKNRKQISLGFKGFINWVRPSMETGGFSASEKLTAAVIVACVVIPSNIIFMLSKAGDYYKLGAIISAELFVALLFKIITPQQLAELKSGIKPSEENNPK